MRSWFSGALLAAALLLTPTVAAAQLQVGLDLDAIFPVDDPWEGETGFGIAGRLGFLLPGTPMFDIAPELQVGYLDFGAPDITEVDMSLVRATAGLRVSWGTILRPTAFAHLGFGSTSLSAEDELDFFRERGGIGEEEAFTWDAGLALDLAILPLVDVGIHGAYNVLATDEALKWWSAGLHGAVTF